MNVLLDTHAFLSAIADPRLSPPARKIFEQNELVLSVASVSEIVTKVAIGKLALPAKPAYFCPPRLRSMAFLCFPYMPAMFYGWRQCRFIIAIRLTACWLLKASTKTCRFSLPIRCFSHTVQSCYGDRIMSDNTIRTQITLVRYNLL